MREIKLTRGKSAIVDDDDYDWISEAKWHCSVSGYAVTNVMHKKIRKSFFMHRIISGSRMGLHNADYVDHINRNKLDNRKSNLRSITKQENSFNSRSRPGTSKFKGVCWEKRRNRFRSTITINGKQKHICESENEIECAKAYDKAANKHYGQFAYLNFPHD